MIAPVILLGRCLDASGERDCIIKFEDLEKITLTVAQGSTPSINSRLVCSIPQLGLLTFDVATMADSGVRLGLLANNDRKRRLATRLEWLSASATLGERRVAVRVVPRVRDVTLELDGARTRGRVRDLSASGVAIDLTERPPLGTLMTVGARRAVVARHTDDGVALRFVLPIHPADVHEDTIL